MFNLQGSEIIVILLLALVVLGPEKLPDAIRKFSQTYGELKKMGNGFQSELKSALDEPMREMRETADLVRRSADPARMAEEAENEAHLRAKADAAALNGTADLPIDPAAFAVSDPAATAAEADESAHDDPAAVDDDDRSDAVLSGAAPLTAAPVNGEPVKKVNQIALSMARGPIDPQPEPVTVPAAPPADDAAEATATPLTAMPQGAASMMPPPPLPPSLADDAQTSAP